MKNWKKQSVGKKKRITEEMKSKRDKFGQIFRENIRIEGQKIMKAKLMKTVRNEGQILRRIYKLQILEEMKDKIYEFHEIKKVRNE